VSCAPSRMRWSNPHSARPSRRVRVLRVVWIVDAATTDATTELPPAHHLLDVVAGRAPPQLRHRPVAHGVHRRV